MLPTVFDASATREADLSSQRAEPLLIAIVPAVTTGSGSATQGRSSEGASLPFSSVWLVSVPGDSSPSGVPCCMCPKLTLRQRSLHTSWSQTRDQHPAGNPSWTSLQTGYRKILVRRKAFAWIASSESARGHATSRALVATLYRTQRFIF